MAYQITVSVKNDTNQSYNGLYLRFAGPVYSQISNVTGSPWDTFNVGYTSATRKSYIKCTGTTSVAPDGTGWVRYDYPSSCLYPEAVFWMLNGTVTAVPATLDPSTPTCVQI